MNLLERELDYPFGDTLPAPGDTMAVAPGVKWIRMALPFALDHINLWLLRDRVDGREGWTVVDCCIDRPESRAQWEQVFESQLEGMPIVRVIVTHMHPDHIGLAHWLCERWNVRMWISSTDYTVARINTLQSTGNGGEGAAAFFAAHGLTDPQAQSEIRNRRNYYSSLVPGLPQQYRRMMDGDEIEIGSRSWRCISGYGHAPEHIALYCDELKVLIGGDMMLPRISTNVSVYEMEPEANPLALFLDSIDKFAPLPKDTLTLPAHGKPFRNLHARIRQLHDHHRDRLAEVMQACSEKPCSAHDVLPVLFKRKLDLHQTTFAMGESVAHLHMLWFAGKLARELGADRTWQFRGSRMVSTARLRRTL
jgi:glyoxylase-like metal-dependent hydrolase (beta-lactamase superfamily II)